MVADFDDLARLEHANRVSILDRAQPVGNSDRSPATILGRFHQGSLYDPFAFSI